MFCYWTEFVSSVANGNHFIFPFHILMSLVVFSGLIALSNASRKILNSNEDGCILISFLTLVGMTFAILH